MEDHSCQAKLSKAWPGLDWTWRRAGSHEVVLNLGWGLQARVDRMHSAGKEVC